MKTTKEKLEETLKELQALQEKYEQEEMEATIERLKPLRKLAEKAHGIFCTHNHTNDCRWEYEENKDKEKMWQGWEHKQYLNKVENFIKWNNLTNKQFNAALDKFAEIKDEYPFYRRLIQHF